MNEQTQEKRGGGFAKLVGGVAGGAVLGKVVDTHVARRGIKEALTGNENVKGKFKQVVEAARSSGLIPNQQGAAAAEKELITTIRKSEGVIAGLKNSGWGGRLTIGAGVIAGIAVGGALLHKIFGPRKQVQASTIEIERNEQAVAPSRA